jgi:hypothetical protein
VPPPGFNPGGGLPGVPVLPGVAPPGVAPPGGMPPGQIGNVIPNDKVNASPTMTCVGLLGLAMGYGVAPAGEKGSDKEKLDNPAIKKGLDTLSRFVGTPSADPNTRPGMENLYLLWSIERVGVLYDLKTIGGKDWYAWGAQILLANQQSTGGWNGGSNGGHTYTGAMDVSDTSFALLFLKRANLMADLTEHLRLNMVIRDPGAK